MLSLTVKKLFMRKRTLQLLFLAIPPVFTFFVGCQKKDTSQSFSPYKTVELVPENVARAVAEKFNPNIFFRSDNSNTSIDRTPIKSAYKTTIDGNNRIKNQIAVKDSNDYPAFYIFNFENNGGFLFVSADYNIQPILAFVEQGEFKKDTVPPTFIEWANRTFENTEVVRKGLYDNSKGAKAAWDQYFKQNNIQNGLNNKIAPVVPGCQENTTNVTVGPLLPVTWGQGCSYNDLCPSKGCTNICFGSSAAWTGCVATSTAQIIRYWQPTTQYGYNYISMPTGSGNIEVQRLMRDIGLPANVGMDYQCSGSGADAGRVPSALKNNFGFASANRISYGDGTYQRVEDNLRNRWPVLLEGCRSKTNNFLGLIYSYSDCHEWVCDGYSDTDYYWCNADGTQGGVGLLYFHMNWGFHELQSENDYNGWFAFNNWNIPGLNWNYIYSNGAVTEIHP